MPGELGQEVLAGAIGGGAVVCGAVAGPLWATVLDLGSALATAGIAVHALEETARAQGLPPRPILSRTARELTRDPEAPLAAHALEVVYRARSGDSRVLRAAAILVGRATTVHARGLALQLLGSWCAPLRKLTTLGAPLAAARAAMDGAELVRAMREAVTTSASTPPVPVVFDWAPPTENDDSYLETLADTLEEAA
jgi:hypothetical protein